MNSNMIVLVIIVSLVIVIAIMSGIIAALVSEIRRWRLKVAYLESEIKRNDKEMLQ